MGGMEGGGSFLFISLYYLVILRGGGETETHYF